MKVVDRIGDADGNQTRSHEVLAREAKGCEPCTLSVGHGVDTFVKRGHRWLRIGGPFLRPLIIGDSSVTVNVPNESNLFDNILKVGYSTRGYCSDAMPSQPVDLTRQGGRVKPGRQ